MRAQTNKQKKEGEQLHKFAFESRKRLTSNSCFQKFVLFSYCSKKKKIKRCLYVLFFLVFSFLCLGDRQNRENKIRWFSFFSFFFLESWCSWVNFLIHAVTQVFSSYNSNFSLPSSSITIKSSLRRSQKEFIVQNVTFGRKRDHIQPI